MTPERWQEIDDLFDRALRVDPAGRADWLERACPDAGLRAEVGRLLDGDDRAGRGGLFDPPTIPPGEPAGDRTGSWPPRDGRGRSGPAPHRRSSGPSTPDDGGFDPVAAIAPSGSTSAGEEVRAVVRARLRELSVIYAAVFGMLLWLRPLILGIRDPLVTTISGLAILALVGVAALLWGRAGLSLVRLRRVELAVLGMLAAVVASYEYQLLLSRSRMGDPTTAQLVMKNVVLLVSILILTYGIYVPKSLRRAASAAFPLAVLPMAVLLALYAAHPDEMGWLEAPRQGRVVLLVLYGMDMLFLLTLAGVSSYAAHMLSRLRREVVEARLLGQYRLRRRIGSGGMGEVYLAEHQLLKRPCAIKLVRPGNTADPRALERFEREVRLTATLSHPNTVEIFDYGRTEDGTYYYVMEFLPGLSLAELVERYGPLPPDRAVYLLRQVCLALHEAHAAGLIHRDIKPSNIFAARRGGVDDVAKLLDFGLVRPAAAARPSGLSAEGQIVGTPLYMSPEQAMGAQELDSRTDVYSLGAVAYFLLTGRPPFDEGTGLGAMIAHARDPVVPPSRLRPGVPDDVERVVLRCLAKAPADRYPGAEALEADLAGCARPGGWDQRRARDWWRDNAPAPAVEAARDAETVVRT